MTQEAFESLLAAFHQDRDEAARRYQSLRQRLIFFFAQRQFTQAESLADQVLDRLARRISSGEQIDSLASYAYGIAKFVAQEEQRHVIRQDAASREYVENNSLLSDTRDDELLQKAMEDCLSRQSKTNRKVLIQYYTFRGQTKIEHRRKLAIQLQLTPSGLRKHTFHLRRAIEACVRAHLAKKAGSEEK